MTVTAKTGNHGTVEDLIRYAVERFQAVGVSPRPAKLSKLIRSAMRTYPGGARSAVDDFLDAEADRQIKTHLFGGFELFVHDYADPTGAKAAQHVDAVRAHHRTLARGGDA